VSRKIRFIVLLALLPFVSCFLGSSSGAIAQSTPSAKKSDSHEHDKGRNEAESILPSTDEAPVPVDTDKLDQTGEMLGKKIDEVGKGASRKVGKWITTKAFLGITWLKLVICVLLLFLVIAVERLVRHLLLLQLKARSAEDGLLNWWILFLGAVQKPVSLFIHVYGIYWALTPLLGYFDSSGSHNMVHRAASKIADVGGIISLFWFVYKFITIFDVQLRRWAASTESNIDSMLVPLIGKTMRVFIIGIGGIMIVQNMTGIEIAPLIASLGIGGLAVALAGKDSIANFFGSLTILLDKPFQVGERIAIDSYDGFVENVGFRSTRLRTLNGNLVSIPNEKIINSTLKNIGRRSFIRWRTDLGLTYDTPPEKVERALQILREIFENHEGMRADYPPRIHFNNFKDWSLNITVFVWYYPPSYWDFQDWLQKTYLEIMRRFKEEGIEFAFPTQTIYHANEARQSDFRYSPDENAPPQK